MTRASDQPRKSVSTDLMTLTGDKEEMDENKHRQKVNVPLDLFIIDMTGASLLRFHYFCLSLISMMYSYQSIMTPIQK